MRQLRRARSAGEMLRRDRAGFLLVEALATLAISAAILLGLASVLGLVLRATDQVATRAEELETTTRAIAAVKRDLQSVTRGRWAGAARTSFIFSGASDKIMFTRGVRDARGVTSEAAVVIQSVATIEGGRLLRAAAPLLPGTASVQQLEFGAPRNIYEGRYLIRLAYFAPAGEGSGDALDAWLSDRMLPSAVRIGVVDPATGKLVSSLRIPIMMEAEAGCAAPDVGFCSHIDPTRKPGNKTRPAAPGGALASGRR